MSSPLSDVVSGQYERWMYPQPILDIGQWLVSNWQWFDPSHSQRVLWPEREPREVMDILVAGCGTNQAAILAYTNPRSNVVAIDVSKPSLAHHRYLMDRYGMKNLTLHHLPIEEVEKLGEQFDLIVSTGVLHHLASPEMGLQALSRCLRHDGVLALMLYARYGRVGVEMMQGVFRDLGFGQNDVSLLMVREMLEKLPQDHPVKSYVAIAPDLRFDAGVVDTFLHGRERSYTVEECLSFVSGAGLSFQDFFLKAPYAAPPVSAGGFGHAVAALPREKQWAVMERINFRNGCHFFMARHPERAAAARIDFAGEAARTYRPSLRYRCALNGLQLSRQNWSMTLEPAQAAVVELADGRRSIAEISERAAASVNLSAGKAPMTVDGVCGLFERLWQIDFVAISVNPEL